MEKHNQTLFKSGTPPLYPLERQVGSSFPRENWVNVRTLVAVSGGPDSVAVTRAMVSIGKSVDHWDPGRLIVAHVNHAIRGAESESDAIFVRELAGQLGLDFHQSDAEPTLMAGSSEESLRNFRYERLVDLARNVGARYIVTGHNRDDQVETILFRIFRGTGISGLAGIPSQRLANDSVTIVRPLLQISRQAIDNYLREIGQAYCFDSSNTDVKYTRNYLRNHLIPELENRLGPSVSDSIFRLGQQAQEIDCFLLAQTRPLADAIEEQTAHGFAVDCGKLQSLEPLIIRRWLADVWVQQQWPRQAMTFHWWQEITQAIRTRADVVLNLPCSIRMEKAGKFAVFSDLRAAVGPSEESPE